LKVKLIVIGKTDASYLKEGENIYESRFRNYLPFERVEIPALKNSKNSSVHEQKKKEGELILKEIESPDIVILLDEGGKQYSSTEFAGYMQHKMNAGIKTLAFVIGGPYGFSDEVYKRTNEKVSLSKMTFSHQMVRLFFIEQLYRAMTIIKREKYHHS
jgi:23S rRNA (pseudouridine1915-N3)-methyltransferase